MPLPPRFETLFPTGAPATPRGDIVTIPTRIDATTAPGDFVDVIFDWMPGVPQRLRIPKGTAIALGSDLLALGASRTVVPGPHRGTRNPSFPGHRLETSTLTPPIDGIPVHAAHEAPQDDDSVSPRAPAVAPPAIVARFPRPGGHPPSAVPLPQRRRSRRAGFFSAPNLFAWGLIAALLVAAIVLRATGAGHVGD